VPVTKATYVPISKSGRQTVKGRIGRLLQCSFGPVIVRHSNAPNPRAHPVAARDFHFPTCRAAVDASNVRIGPASKAPRRLRPFIRLREKITDVPAAYPALPMPRGSLVVHSSEWGGVLIRGC